MSHTPGPWNIVGDEMECKVIRAGDGIATHICQMHGAWICDEHGGTPLDNARLIAAAPDLLAALKEVVAIADRKTDEFDRARAAIAKAEGK